MREKGLAWWQLSLIGVGSIIGAGFFLGTSLSIRTAGPSVLIGYIIAALATYIVFTSLAEMTIHDPRPGSFRAYARMAFGHSAGFLSGWIYWLAGLLIMSSEIIALSTFTAYWFPNVPHVWFSLAYAVLGFAIIFMGVRNFSQIESGFAVVKIAILVGFILFGALFVLNAIHLPSGIRPPGNIRPWFPNGATGLWSAMIFVFFSFGGIEVVGVTSSELRRKEDVAKAGVVLIISLGFIYVLSLWMVLRMANWTAIDESASPFVTALSGFNIPYLDSIFNLVIISAAFSTMVGSLFSISRIMVSLANDGDAPRVVQVLNRRGVPTRSLLMTAIALAICMGCAYVLPDTIYEYITTSAGVMLILNWILILASYLKLRPRLTALTVKRRLLTNPYTGIVLILFALSGALLHQNERIGLGISLALIVIVFVASRFASKR
ncbi:amino acid permease [Paenibacillus glycanilyticus]|uniref:Transporter n=1 Tax=Paenibacillus glycanilyticus TaxID=126569 RepID=A0ABQ6GLE3_9BACL|nr:amino acid permease [Paenibacillus glycanilyticus]GLX70431.1 transporter [Paenibacillus glycanilyticus]